MTGFNALGGGHTLWGVAVQPDGAIEVNGSASSGTRSYMSAARFSADGKLDSTFGTGGVLVPDLTIYHSYGKQVVLQPDGRILATGQVGFSSGAYTGYNFVTVRLWP